MTPSNTFYSSGSEVPLKFERGSWQLQSSRIKRFLEEESVEEKRSRFYFFAKG